MIFSVGSRGPDLQAMFDEAFILHIHTPTLQFPQIINVRAYSFLGSIELNNKSVNIYEDVLKHPLQVCRRLSRRICRIVD